MRAKVEIEEKGQTQSIVVTELPYQVSAGAVARKIAELVNSRELEGIRDINDESSGDDTRFVITLKRTPTPRSCSTTSGRPRRCRRASASTWSPSLVVYSHAQPARRATGLCRSPDRCHHPPLAVPPRYRRKAPAHRRRSHQSPRPHRRDHRHDPRKRGSRCRPRSAIAGITPRWGRSRRLFRSPGQPHSRHATRSSHPSRSCRSGDGTDRTHRDHYGLQEILGDENKLREVIVDELGEVRETFAEPRRSSLEIDPGEFDIEDLIDDDPLVFTMTATGYVKTTPADEFRAQGRGGRGIAGPNSRTRTRSPR